MCKIQLFVRVLQDLDSAAVAEMDSYNFDIKTSSRNNFKTRIEEAIEELIDLIFEKVSSDFFANTVQMPQYLIYSTF